MAENLTFRLFQPDDLAGILRLWEEDSGWGGITAQQFNNWYVNTPYGECLIVIAVNEEKRIIGQKIFTPSRISIDGEEKKALRLSAPILTKEFRARISNESHPITGMYKLGAKTAFEKGFNLIYSFPVPAWLPVIKLMFPKIGIDMKKVVTAQIECSALSAKAFSDEKNKYSVSISSSFNDDYNALWQSAVENFPLNNAIVRNSNWLNWKLGGHLVLEVRQENKLLGYVAVKKETGLVEDAFARTPDDLETVIKEAIIALSVLKIALPNDEIKMMQTHATAPIIEKLGFQKIDYKLGFWCYSPDDSIPVEKLQLARWFMMPND